MKRFIKISIALLVLVLGSCSEAKDLIDLALDSPGRERIDVAKVGVNDFFVDKEFGTIKQQYAEIHNTLGLKYVRVLLAWIDGVQPTPSSSPQFSFFDNILSSIPPGVDVLIVLAHTPSWMANSGNWINGNPRETWVEKWVRPTVTRYAGRPGIVGWEIWNEPDLTLSSSDAALGLTTPENYIELLRRASFIVRSVDRGKLVLNAATQSIQQNFPTNLNYNKRLRDLGAQGLIDVWNVHYYGTRFESVITNNGVGDFLNDLQMPIWVTESGAQGPNSQLSYVETAWPFLSKKISAISRFYYYQYGSTAPIDQNYGLHSTDPAFLVSDLYIHLANRQAGG